MARPRPVPPKSLRGRGIGLGELLEQLRLLLRRHADASIGNGKLDPVASIGHPARLQLDLALFGELARIAQQIEQNLPQPHRVNRQSAEVLLRVDNQAVLVLLGKLARSTDHLFDQRCELHGLRIELKFPGFDLRQVQHLVDEAEQVGTGAIYALQRFRRLSQYRTAPRW